MMKRFLTLTLLLLSFSFLGCGSPEGGLVTNQGDMTLEEYEAMVAKAQEEGSDKDPAQ